MERVPKDMRDLELHCKGGACFCSVSKPPASAHIFYTFLPWEDMFNLKKHILPEYFETQSPSRGVPMMTARGDRSASFNARRLSVDVSMSCSYLSNPDKRRHKAFLAGTSRSIDVLISFR